jgi:poly(hydroxyalkanoate) granule-associated protein
MVKKLKEIAGKEANLAQTVRDSAQQIWLAGLGAFAKAQEEGGKVFEALVKEGKSLEQRTVKTAETRLNAMAEQVGKKTDQATAKATATWDKLEQVFEDRVARSLGRIGVPTNHDLQELVRRVEELTASVEKLSGGAKKAAKRTTRRASAK